MKPTRAGIGLVATIVVCLVIGRMFGTLELYLLAGVSIAILVMAGLYTAFNQISLEVHRSAHPSRLRVGVHARVDVSLTNNRSRRTPVIRLDDEIGGTVAASVHLAPIRGRSSTAVAYRLPTSRRGEIIVGPLALTTGDPLGLTSSTVRVPNQVRVVVHPFLMDLGHLQATAGYDPTAEIQPIKALATSGDEFFGLRPYVPGDEPKWVHWRATARTGELVVRQQERPQSGRVTVVLDRRAEDHDDASFDRACSVAISALYAGWRGGDALRFATTTPGSVSDIRSRRDLDGVDERLATLATTTDASLVRTIDELGRSTRGGTLVVITGTATSELEAAIEHARRSFGLVLPIVCRRPAQGATPPPAALVYDDGTPDQFIGAWRSAVQLLGAR